MLATLPRRLLVLTIAGTSTVALSMGYASANAAPFTAATVIQAQKVDSPGTWIDTTTVFEGTRAQAVVSLAGVPAAASGTITIERADGTALGATTTNVGRGSSNVTVPLNLDGAAWSAPGIAAPSDVVAKVSLANGTTLTTPVALTVAPRPLVLLHGLWSAAATWSSYQDFAQSAHPQWRAFAVGDGAYPGKMDTGALLAPLRRPNSVDANATEAWTYLSALRRGLNTNEVDVVGHSMGGIVTRRMLHAQGRAAQDAVRDVVMLGTPNGGSYCAVTWPVPATSPLVPATMRQFNEANPGYPGVESTLIYAEHLVPTCADASRGDSVVPRWSAKAVDVDRLHVASPTLHTSMTADRSMFDRFVVPTLARPRDLAALPSTAVGDGSGVAPDEESIGQLAKEGTNPGGVGISIPIVVAAGEELTVSVVSAQENGLELVGPDGRRASLTPLSDDLPVSTATLTSISRKGTAYLRGSSRAAFDWAFTVTKTDLTMDASVRESGDSVTVRADLTDAQARDVTSVKAQFIDESKDDRRTTQLNDAGADGDLRAGNDVYTGTETVDSEAGETVRVEVSATFADGRERTVIVGYIDQKS